LITAFVNSWVGTMILCLKSSFKDPNDIAGKPGFYLSSWKRTRGTGGCRLLPREKNLQFFKVNSLYLSNFLYLFYLAFIPISNYILFHDVNYFVN